LFEDPMTDLVATRPLGRVLLGATGEGHDWSDLRDHLVSVGWQVDLFDPTPHGGGGRPEEALPLLEGLDLAVLMAPSEARGSAITTRLVYLTGVLRGALGDRRVVVMVERDADSLVHGAKGPEIRYQRGDIRSRFSHIDSILDGVQAEGQTSMLAPWLARLGVVDGRVPPELLVGLGAALVVLALFGVLGVQVFGSSATVASIDPAAPEATSSTTTVGDQAPGVTSGGGATASGGLVAPVPDVGGEGRVAQLPALCVVDLGPDVTLPAVIGCDGIGGLRVEGDTGPWHERVYHVELDAGVAGDLVTGSPATGDAERVPLPSQARSVLAGSEVRRLELIFAADGQQVRVEEPAEDGGAVLTLVFSLDLGS
jgi:hypothetical protein